MMRLFGKRLIDTRAIKTPVIISHYFVRKLYTGNKQTLYSVKMCKVANIIYNVKRMHIGPQSEQCRIFSLPRQRIVSKASKLYFDVGCTGDWQPKGCCGPTIHEIYNFTNTEYIKKKNYVQEKLIYREIK